MTITTPTHEIKDYYNISIEDIFANLNLNIDLEKGLTTKQAEKSQELYGRNELKKQKKSLFKVLIAPLINLLIIIYFISAFAMWALGEVNRTIPTFIILGFNAGIAIIQQWRAEKKLEALKKLSAATSFVLRDGKMVTLSADEIVIGDIIKLNPGDKIPADCRIIESNQLLVNESSLTGESEPVKKATNFAPIEGVDLPLHSQKNMVFLGTYITSGRATVLVVKIGSNTEIGKINTLLAQTETGEIPLRNKMNNVAKKLGIMVVVLLIISIIYKTILLIDADNFMWETFRRALINSIDTGMKVMPINLPLLTTIVLITGVLAMAKKGVIVRELSRTEALGRVSVVCSDKTGTLTKNEMTTVIVWTPDMEYGVSGFGYKPDGIIYDLRTGQRKTDEKLHNLIISGYLNNNAQLTKEVNVLGGSDVKGDLYRDVWSIKGLPTEASLLVLGKKYDPQIDQILHEYEFVYEFNFDSNIKRMSKIFRSNKDGKYHLFLKGAPDWTINLASHYEDNSGMHVMDEIMRAEIHQGMNLYAAAGYRVLAIYNRILDKKAIPEDWEQENLRESIEKNLNFLGLVVILDPPREDVAEAVVHCKSAGITVVMITGDNLSTGMAIGRQLGIFEDEHHLAFEGKMLESLTDTQFVKTTVFGRVSPEHKQIIVKRYQNMHKVVSMTGDGVNDALALSLADCGLAMGIQGTEVAKEAADMVITDDSFSTIVSGIENGRGLFYKIRVIIYFFLCVSIMEAAILFISSMNPNPDWSMWDYWQLNLLYVTCHSFPSIGFTFLENAKTTMQDKPRDSAEIITKEEFKLLIPQILMMGIPIVTVYYMCFFGIIPVNDFNMLGITTYTDSANELITIGIMQSKARTMGFLVLFLLESLVLPFQIRRINTPIRESIKDVKEIGWYIDSPIMIAVLIYVVPLQNFMGSLGWSVNLMFLSGTDWIICILFCLPSIIGFDLLREKLGIIPKRMTDRKLKIKIGSKIIDLSGEESPEVEPGDPNAEDLVKILLEERGKSCEEDILEMLMGLGYSEKIARNTFESMKERNLIRLSETEPNCYEYIPKLDN